MVFATGGASLPLQSWMWNPFPNTRIQRLVTSQCAPGIDIYRETMGLMRTDYHYNVQTKIVDPTVFNVPTYCKHGKRNTGDSKVLKDFLGKWNMGFFQF